jgi:penicillin-binding protein 1A
MMANENKHKSDEPDAIWSRLWRVAKWTLAIGALLGLMGAGGVGAIFIYYSQSLPSIMTRSDYDPKEVTRVYASGGELVGEFHETGGHRTVVSMDEIPEHVQFAFMAAEDADFMNHEGIDYWGMLRAVYYTVFHGRRLQGTSTITQQVVKNLILVPDRTIERKVKEIMLARDLEGNLSKKDILFLYLNSIYLGHGRYGVEEASRFYFGKSASELEIHESALLAGLPPAPADLSPARDEEAAKQRRSYVLRQLWEKGFIEEAAYRKAKRQPIELSLPDESFPHLDDAKYFVEHVRRKLVERYGEEPVYTGGLRVHTTLEVDKQIEATRAARAGLQAYDERRGYYDPVRTLEDDQAIEAFRTKQSRELEGGGLDPGETYEAVVTEIRDEEPRLRVDIGDIPGRVRIEARSRVLRKAETLDERFSRGDVLEVRPQASEPDESGSVPVRLDPGPQVALVSIAPGSHDVVAMVGGYRFEHHRFNHAIQAERQTGSTFKPFVYGAGLEEKIITPATIYLDSPAVFQMPDGKQWSPRNSDREWRGPVRVREGLGASRNVVAVRVLKDVGVETAQNFARRMGVERELVDNYTMVMGSSELTPLGLTNAYATIASGGVHAEPRFLTRVERSNGNTQTFEVESKRVLAPDVAYLLTDLMTSVVEGYVDRKGRSRGGTAHSLSKLKQRVAGKTGTTNDTRDAWFVGFTPQLVTGAWVGFDDNRSLGYRAFGGKVAGPIWLDYMQSVLGEKEPHEFEPPSTGITRARIDPATGKLARKEGIPETFLVGTAPTEYAPADEEEREEHFLMGQFESGDSEASADEETSDSEDDESSDD